MGYGLQVFSETGAEIFNSATQTLRLVDVFETGIENGQKTYTGKSRIMLVYAGETYNHAQNQFTARVVCENSQVRWDFGNHPKDERKSTLLYIVAY